MARHTVLLFLCKAVHYIETEGIKIAVCALHKYNQSLAFLPPEQTRISSR